MVKWRFSNDDFSPSEADAVVVIGLGRFGQSLALELMATGVEVLGIDSDPDIVQDLNGHLTHVVRADATKEEVLRQLAVPEFSIAVVAIGNDVEASILATAMLLKFEIPTIWAKAVSDPHGLILSQLGISHVVYPEKDMGRRVAHLVRGSMQDYIEIGEDFVMVRTTPPTALVGIPLAQANVRHKYGVTVTAVKPEGGRWTYCQADTVLHTTDTILVAGTTRKAELFTRL